MTNEQSHASAAPVALWVAPVSDLGGVARHILDVARVGLPGWRLVVTCPAGPLADAVEALGVPTIRASIGPDSGAPTAVRELRRIIAALRPQVVHSHLSFADFIASAATIGSNATLVSTEHGIAGDDLVYHGSRARSRVMATAHSARLLRFDALIACAEATAQAMKAKWHPRQPITVIHNGVDPLAEPASPSSGLHIATLSRLAPEKRIDKMIDAFAVVHRGHPEARLTIAGVGPLESELRQHVADSQLSDAVNFPGFVDAASFLTDVDVLAQFSVWENCSYSLLDAVVAGVGVCATPVGGNPEILPSQCLAEADDAAGAAAVMLAQGTHTATRPHLRPNWPTIADMTQRITSVYDAASPKRNA